MLRIKVIACLFLFVASHLHAADATQAAADLALKLKNGLAKRTLNTIAFLELEGPEKTQFGTYMTDKLINAFQRETHVSIFTRLQIEALIMEHKLTLTGVIDPKTTKKFGEMAQVDALATGKYIIFGETVEIDVQVFDVRTAQQIASAETSVSKTKDIVNLLSSIVVPTMDKLPDTSSDSVVTTNANEIYLCIKRLKREGAKLICEIDILNKGNRRELIFFHEDIRIVIDGKSYVPTNIDIFSKKYYTVRGVLPYDVQTALELEFFKVPIDGKIVSHLDLNFRVSNEMTNFEFRNIPIQN